VEDTKPEDSGLRSIYFIKRNRNFHFIEKNFRFIGRIFYFTGRNFDFIGRFA
jgi:hypothetical protein